MARRADGWSRKLSEPIILQGKRIETLREARNFLARLSEVQQKNLHWQLTAEALMKAQYYDATRADVEAFAGQFVQSLKIIGLVKVDAKTGKVSPA